MLPFFTAAAILVNAALAVNAIGLEPVTGKLLDSYYI
jgi:hypothetical protein